MLFTDVRNVGRLGLMSALLMLSGCAVGPDYRPAQTQVHMPESWPVIVSTSKAPGTPVPASYSGGSSDNLVQWWTVFNDPELSKLVGEAMNGNLNLKAAELRIFQARASRGITESGLFPHLNYDLELTRSQTPMASRRGIRGNTTSFYRNGLDASWELDFFGGTRRAIEAAEANIDSSVEDQRGVMVSLAAEIGANYITLRGYQKQLAIARDNVVSQEKFVELTGVKLKAGISTGLDDANARALVAQTRAQIPVLESAAQQSIYNIAVLLGREPASLDAELSATAPIPVPPQTIPVGLPSDLLRRRPDIRKAEARIHFANANIGVAKADLFPKFSLTGAGGFQGNKSSSLASMPYRFFNFGPSVTWPIFAAGRIQCNIALQKFLTEETEVNYRQTVLTALQDVDSALYALTKEREHRDALEEAVKAYRQVVQLSLKLYSDGKSDFLNVITAQRSQYEAEDALAQSERALATYSVALFKALGGGWDETPYCSILPTTQEATVQVENAPPASKP